MRNRVRCVSWLVSLSLLAGLITWTHARADPLPEQPRPGRWTVQLEHGGVERVATVVLPPAYEPGKKLPLVLTFHGAGGSGERMLNQNGWAAKARSEGFIAVAPDGFVVNRRLAANFLINPRVWNSGQLRAGSPRTEIDDVAFVLALLDELQEKVGFREDRVFATGHSNGAGMSFRLATEAAERVRAIAPVAGLMAVDQPKPARPVPTLYVIGDADPLLPLAGGESQLPWGRRTTPPVSEYLGTWAVAIGCQAEGQVVDETEHLRTTVYRAANNGPTLTWITIQGQGHSWPGGDADLPARRMGPRSTALDATDRVWEFFQSQLAP